MRFGMKSTDTELRAKPLSVIVTGSVSLKFKKRPNILISNPQQKLCSKFLKNLQNFAHTKNAE